MQTNRPPCANDCTNWRKNSVTAYRHTLKRSTARNHKGADESGRGLSVSVFASRQARQGASAGFSGCRGEALTQSRSDSGVYTGLTMRHQCGLYEKCTIYGVKCRTDA